MESLPKCIKCGSEYTYQQENLYICPECGYEWAAAEEPEDVNNALVIKDAHGNLLQDGDTVTIIKDIKVKGSCSALKVGLKVKNIRLVDATDGHNIEAKVPGFGPMMLKSEIVKKSN